MPSHGWTIRWQNLSDISRWVFPKRMSYGWRTVSWQASRLNIWNGWESKEYAVLHRPIRQGASARAYCFQPHRQQRQYHIGQARASAQYPHLQGIDLEIRFAYGWRKGQCQRNRLKEPDRTKYALYDIIKMEVRQMATERAYRQPETAGVEVHFKHKASDQRGAGCCILHEWLPFQRLQSGQAFQLFQDWRGFAAQQTQGTYGNNSRNIWNSYTKRTVRHGTKELFNGSWGLLKSSGSSYNADAEANQEMVDITTQGEKVKQQERCWSS